MPPAQNRYRFLDADQRIQECFTKPDHALYRYNWDFTEVPESELADSLFYEAARESPDMLAKAEEFQVLKSTYAKLAGGDDPLISEESMDVTLATVAAAAPLGVIAVCPEFPAPWQTLPPPMRQARCRTKGSPSRKHQPDWCRSPAFHAVESSGEFKTKSTAAKPSATVERLSLELRDAKQFLSSPPTPPELRFIMASKPWLASVKATKSDVKLLASAMAETTRFIKSQGTLITSLAKPPLPTMCALVEIDFSQPNSRIVEEFSNWLQTKREIVGPPEASAAAHHRDRLKVLATYRLVRYFKTSAAANRHTHLFTDKSGGMIFWSTESRWREAMQKARKLLSLLQS